MGKGDPRTELTKDQRPILSVWHCGVVEWLYEVGDNCDSIEPYAESGHMSMVPWIAVYKDGQIIARIAADNVSIHYTPNKR